MEEQPPNKKRKITLDKISLPRLNQMLYLVCYVCREKVYNYGICQKYVYCSYDCFSILMLADMNNQEYTNFIDS